MEYTRWFRRGLRPRRGEDGLLKFLIDGFIKRPCNLIESVFNLIKELVTLNTTHHVLHFNIAQRVHSAAASP